MGDYDWIAPLVGGALKGLNSTGAADSANDITQAALDKMLANLQARFGEYDALGPAGYKDIDAQQLGPSALGGIQNDAQSQLAQQQAIAALTDLADRGGLGLADMNALNQVEGNLNRNNMARQKGLANEFAARGQLGSGAQMALALQGQSDAAMGANQRAEGIAAQAQDRALQAILRKGEMARGMGNDSYSRQRDAAMARDAIEARNAAARTDASKYNNTLRGADFDNSLQKLRGKGSLTESMNRAIFDKGSANKNTVKAKADYANDMIGGVAGAVSKFGSGGGASGSINADDPNDVYARGTDYGSSNPDEWDNPYGGY